MCYGPNTDILSARRDPCTSRLTIGIRYNDNVIHSSEEYRCDHPIDNLHAVAQPRLCVQQLQDVLANIAAQVEPRIDKLGPEHIVAQIREGDVRALVQDEACAALGAVLEEEDDRLQTENICITPYYMCNSGICAPNSSMPRSTLSKGLETARSGPCQYKAASA